MEEDKRYQLVISITKNRDSKKKNIKIYLKNALSLAQIASEI